MNPDENKNFKRMLYSDEEFRHVLSEFFQDDPIAKMNKSLDDSGLSVLANEEVLCHE